MSISRWFKYIQRFPNAIWNTETYGIDIFFNFKLKLKICANYTGIVACK